jgi:MscS family membrane protein
MKCFIFLFMTLLGLSVSGSEEHPLLPADTSSPKATLNTFMENCTSAYHLLKAEGRTSENEDAVAEGHDLVRRITRCLDLSEVAEFRRNITAKESAVTLKEVLDRIELPKETKIPDLKAVTNEDGTFLESWTIPNTEITFTRVKTGALAGTYQFSPETVARSGEFYNRVKHLPYKKGATEGFAGTYLTSPGSIWLAKVVNQFPPSMLERRNGQAIWQWAGLAIVLLLTLIIMTMIYAVGRRVSRGGAEAGAIKYLLGLAFPIMVIFVPINAQAIITNELVISGPTYYIIKFNLALISLFAAMIVVLGIGKRVGEVIATAPHIAKRSIDAQLIRLMTRMVGFIAAMVLLLEGGQHLGIPLSSLLAGAGVVGMALALSAQDVLKNVFGSIMLIMDKPFVAGERIQVKSYDGVVEEVGLRSTKIRLLNGHQVSIPNEQLARADIENIGRRPFIRRVTQIRLPVDIGSAKAKTAADIVQDLLKDHEGCRPDFPPRVWLSEFEDDHLELKLIYWYHPPNYWDYTAHADQVNRGILDAFEGAGIGIAVPAFTTRIEDQAGLPVIPPD